MGDEDTRESEPEQWNKNICLYIFFIHYEFLYPPYIPNKVLDFTGIIIMKDFFLKWELKRWIL